MLSTPIFTNYFFYEIQRAFTPLKVLSLLHTLETAGLVFKMDQRVRPLFRVLDAISVSIRLRRATSMLPLQPQIASIALSAAVLYTAAYRLQEELHSEGRWPQKVERILLAGQLLIDVGNVFTSYNLFWPILNVLSSAIHVMESVSRSHCH